MQDNVLVCAPFFHSGNLQGKEYAADQRQPFAGKREAQSRVQTDQTDAGKAGNRRDDVVAVGASFRERKAEKRNEDTVHRGQECAGSGRGVRQPDCLKNICQREKKTGQRAGAETAAVQSAQVRCPDSQQDQTGEKEPDAEQQEQRHLVQRILQHEVRTAPQDCACKQHQPGEGGTLTVSHTADPGNP